MIKKETIGLAGMKTERRSAEEMAGFGIAQMNRVKKLISGTKNN